MSAPTTHDPLVVTTRNGVTWVRRAVVDGRGLYAVTDSCKCPEYLMATLAELAEHGIAGSAGALPMPVAPEPQAQSDADELAAFRALELGDVDGRRSACCGKPGHLTWLRKIDDTRACPWCVMELQNDSLVARTHQLTDYQRLEWEREAAGRADESREAVANLRIAELNRERDTLLARVAELEAERHSTNEALDDAVQALRVNAEQALPWAHEMPDGDLGGFLDDLVSAALNRWRTDPDGPVPDRVTLADIERVCREWRTPGVGYRSDPEPEFHEFLHKGRVPHDLPETGGVS